MSAGEPLGILAGDGELPLRLDQGAIQAGRPVFVVGIEGWAEPSALAGLPHAVERLGATSAILGHLRARGIRQLVLAGRASRPSIASLRPDAFGVTLLARLGKAFFAG